MSACGLAIERDYFNLQTLVARRPPEQRRITTADLWLWVAHQAGPRFTDSDINDVLVAARVDDEQDVTLAQFTHTVVHMFEAFFAMLDADGTGFVTEVRSSPANCCRS